MVTRDAYGMLDPVTDERSRRMRWTELPAHVRAAVEDALGSRVVHAVSQPGGYSTGTADRVLTAAGPRAFVKAISTGTNGTAAALHRQEAHVSAALPDDLPVPRLLGVHDDGDWIALVLEDVEGRHPARPWQEPELSAVLDALEALADRLTPTPIAGVPAAKDAMATHFGGWERIATSPPTDLDGWAAAHLPRLTELSADALAAMEGDTLVHYDVRADNLLVRADGRVVVVDWPWACRGPAWLDTLLLVQDVHLHGGHDTDALLRRGATARVDPAVLTAVLVAVTGYVVDASRLPAPDGMEHLRAYQRAKAESLLPWVRRRLART